MHSLLHATVSVLTVSAGFRTSAGGTVHFFASTTHTALTVLLPKTSIIFTVLEAKFPIAFSYVYIYLSFSYFSTYFPNFCNFPTALNAHNCLLRNILYFCHTFLIQSVLFIQYCLAFGVLKLFQWSFTSFISHTKIVVPEPPELYLVYCFRQSMITIKMNAFRKFPVKNQPSLFTEYILSIFDRCHR